MLATLLMTALVASGGWTNYLATGQLQCGTARYQLTIGIPSGADTPVVRVERDGATLAEQKLHKYTQASVSIMDMDNSKCEEALVDLVGGGKRGGLLVSVPEGKPAITVFPTGPQDGQKARRAGARISVYHGPAGKLCIADYELRADTLRKVSDECY
jgi:hypothetical protein